MVVQAIQVHQGKAPIYVLMSIDTGFAQLVVQGASEMTEVAWDEAMRFCWEAGWEPRQDEPDFYMGSTDTELYVLVEVEDDEEEDDVEHSRQAESL